jgi:hypothetical protein
VEQDPDERIANLEYLLEGLALRILAHTYQSVADSRAARHALKVVRGDVRA